VAACLTLRVVYGLPLRQTQGLMRSVAELMDLDVLVPDFSTLSRRSKGLVLPPAKHRCGTQEPVHRVVDCGFRELTGQFRRSTDAFGSATLARVSSWRTRRC
jgi:hypothetical protein